MVPWVALAAALAACCRGVSAEAGPTAANMSDVVVGRGGYPRGVQLSSGVWLVCVGMDIHSSPDGRAWTQLSTVLRDAREGVDLANCNLAQLPSGRVLASYRHHVPQGKAMRYAIEVSASEDGGRSWAPLSSMVSGPVGMWEPYLWPPTAAEHRPTLGGSGGADTILAAYSQELTNGGLQSIVWQRSDDGGASWKPAVTISDGRQHHSRDGMPGITRLADNSLLMVFEGFWDYFAHNTTERHHFSVQARRSHDDGASWSEGEVIFTPKGSKGINAGAPQVIASPSGAICKPDHPEPSMLSYSQRDSDNRVWGQGCRS